MITTEQISPETHLGNRKAHLGKLMQIANAHGLFQNRSEYSKAVYSVKDKDLSEVEEGIKTMQEILTKKGISYERC